MRTPFPRAAIAAALLTLPTAASAATVQVTVRQADGTPLRDAVVMVESAAAPRAMPRGPYVMEQKNIAFQPHVLVVPVGAQVLFPNRDTVRHHVYSFSKPKRFDLKLYGREDQRSVTFDTAGVVALGCNIHDTMNGFIVVSATPFFATADAQGHVVIPGVPAGGVTLRVFSPAIRAPGNTLAQAASVPAAGYATTLTIRR
ncbi:methylamine utilization protein [Sphingomonas sp. A2-49]|uniref:methylamine utilization protein n=1 Tax=Sphingomonas sp. A2-49 TaxID=1391375 RepID=UPI0021D38949|nr:methylamine utilization protein [Sphingomonas sp. A2-49]MCU6453704.1 methylamine utilization protein [Sphingomonas sp. A2-49]